MTKMTAKRAFVTSVTALFLCFAMLLGTTFAWFTDSVSSTNNIIKSGNLDVVFEYWNGTEWVSVDEASDILVNDLWEPGVAEVAYFRVANAGSLALKYQLGINIVNETEGTNAADNSFKLSDFIMFGVVEDMNAENGVYGDGADERAKAIAEATDVKLISEGYTQKNNLYPVNNIPTDIADATSETYFALVVYMPIDVDNTANYKTSDEDGNPDKYRPAIQLGITVVATQLNAEEDSFGSDYDADTTTPVAVATAEELQAALNNAVDGDRILFADNIVGNVTALQKAGVNVIVDGNGKTFTGVLTVDGDGRQSGSETLVISNVNFVAAEGADSCIYSPDRNDRTPAKYSYSHNVTVVNCTFTDPDGAVNCAAIRHGDGGDKNWTVSNCTVDNTMHSLLQVNNVNGKLIVDGCTVESKNGLNLNSSTNVEIVNCDVNVLGYAVRFGVNSGGNGPDVVKSFLIKDSTLQSANDDGDAVIIFRADATVNSTLTLENTTLIGTPEMSGSAETIVR